MLKGNAVKRVVPFKTVYTNDQIHEGKLNKGLVLVDLHGDRVVGLEKTLPVGLPWRCIPAPKSKEQKLLEAISGNK